MEDNAKLTAKSNAEICEIKTKSKKEILKVTTTARKDVQKAEDTSVARSIKAHEPLRAKRVTTSRNSASTGSEGTLKQKATEIEVSKLSEKFRQETDRATAAMNMANIAVMHKERRLKAQYRSTIESLEDQLKSTKECHGNITNELKLKDKNQRLKWYFSGKIMFHGVRFLLSNCACISFYSLLNLSFHD